MDALWTNIAICLEAEKANPFVKALATRQYNFKGTLCPLSLACWRMFQAQPGSAKGVNAITGIPVEEIYMVNGEYDRQVNRMFGGRNAVDAVEAIEMFIDAIEYVRCKDDLPSFEQVRLKTTDRKRLYHVRFYDPPYREQSAISQH